jgi:O-antigen/teichoic acid export membrane protein
MHKGCSGVGPGAGLFYAALLNGPAALPGHGDSRGTPLHLRSELSEAYPARRMNQDQAKATSPSLTHRAVSGMMWVAWGSGAMAALKIGVLVVLTRLLSPADFGLVAAGLVVIDFSLNFSQLGLGPALVQRAKLEPRHLSTAFFASSALGLLVGTIIFLSAPLLAEFFRMRDLVPVVRILALSFPVTGTAIVSDSLLSRELRFRVIANRDVFAYATGYGVVGITLAALGWGVWALVAAQLTQTTVRTAILLRVAPPRLSVRPTWGSFVELMDYGLGQSVARVGVILANQADNLVVGRWLGAAALGLYSRAYQLMSVPTALVGDMLDKVLFPTMSQVQHDLRRLATAYLRGMGLLALVTMPAGVVAAVLAPELVAVAFGPRWQALVPPFQVLALGMMFRTGGRMSDSLSRATGRVYRRAWRQAAYAALVFLGALVGRHWGVTGVAVGVVAALLANYLMMAHLSLTVVGVSWVRFGQAQLPAVRVTLAVAVVTLGAAAGARQLQLPALAALLVGLAAAGGTALMAARLAPRLALGEDGIRMKETLRAFLEARLRTTGRRA